MTVNELNEIEERLKLYKYKEIPKEFIKKVEKEFSAYSYLKSLLEMKKQDN